METASQTGSELPDTSETWQRADDLTTLEGVNVDYEDRKFIDRGRVDAVATDGCSLCMAQEAAANYSRSRIRQLIDAKMLQTAFQPIRSLISGELLGVEALCRFPNSDTMDTQYWFDEAASVGLTSELEFAALAMATQAAQGLPSPVYLALNISPATCLDPRLPRILERSSVPMDRIVLELTERQEVTEYGPLISALEVLRRSALRVAVDDVGSGFASLRHILHIRPDIIKLDRSLISGIDDNPDKRALSAALAEFARQIGATLVAEGIETNAELAVVTGIGMTVGQGHLLGRPTTYAAECRPKISQNSFSSLPENCDSGPWSFKEIPSLVCNS